MEGYLCGTAQKKMDRGSIAGCYYGENALK